MKTGVINKVSFRLNVEIVMVVIERRLSGAFSICIFWTYKSLSEHFHTE